MSLVPSQVEEKSRKNRLVFNGDLKKTETA